MIEGPKTMQNPQIRIGIAIQIFLGPKPKKMVKLRDRKVVKLFLITIFFWLTVTCNELVFYSKQPQIAFTT